MELGTSLSPREPQLAGAEEQSNPPFLPKEIGATKQETREVGPTPPATKESGLACSPSTEKKPDLIPEEVVNDDAAAECVDESAEVVESEGFEPGSEEREDEESSEEETLGIPPESLEKRKTLFEKLAIDALEKAKQGRSPLNHEDMEAVIEWLAWYRDSPNRKDNLGQTVSPAHKIDFSLAEPLTIPGVSDVKDENLFSAPDLMGENVEDKKGVSIKGELGAVSPGSGDCVENAASDAVRENEGKEVGVLSRSVQVSVCSEAMSANFLQPLDGKPLSLGLAFMEPEFSKQVKGAGTLQSGGGKEQAEHAHKFETLANLDSDLEKEVYLVSNERAMARFGPRNPADSEEEQKSGEGKVQARASRPCSIIINDALSIRKNMIKMIKDESMDKDFVKFLRTENKSFTAEILRIDKDPDPFSPSKMASLEARMRCLKGLSPIKEAKKIPMSSEQKSQSKTTEGGTSKSVADDAVTETELEGAVPSPLVGKEVFDVMREVKSPVDRALEGTPDACKVVLPKSSSAGDQRFPVQ
ncbi:hypothetical protein U1Q18_041551, partial [Sarracenia purpurea var. burkii]